MWYSRFFGVSLVGMSSKSSCFKTLCRRDFTVSAECWVNSRRLSARVVQFPFIAVVLVVRDFRVLAMFSWTFEVLAWNVEATSDKHSSCRW